MSRLRPPTQRETSITITSVFLLLYISLSTRYDIPGIEQREIPAARLVMSPFGPRDKERDQLKDNFGFPAANCCISARLRGTSIEQREIPAVRVFVTMLRPVPYAVRLLPSTIVTRILVPYQAICVIVISQSRISLLLLSSSIPILVLVLVLCIPPYVQRSQFFPSGVALLADEHLERGRCRLILLIHLLEYLGACTDCCSVYLGMSPIEREIMYMGYFGRFCGIRESPLYFRSDWE